MRKIVYVTGTRADFGLMRSTLMLAQASQKLEISLCVTGMHLLAEYGNTVQEIEDSGLPISSRIPVSLTGESGAEMARALAGALEGMVDAWERERPDLVLLLGDRGEMLAGALAAVHLNVLVGHLHGGERSGTVDEPVRHAISKLAHVHFVATQASRERLIRMGELPDQIHVTGAPGLDELANQRCIGREELCRGAGLDPKGRVALVLFHSVLQEAEVAGEQMRIVMDAVMSHELQALVLLPNADAGGAEIRKQLERSRGKQGICLAQHVPRLEFISWMAAADVMVGNSSAGIIEAPSLGLPVVNIGSRQRFRESSGNATDVPVDAAEIGKAIGAALQAGRGIWNNVYGDGKAGGRIVQLLETLPLDQVLLNKANAY